MAFISAPGHWKGAKEILTVAGQLQELKASVICNFQDSKVLEFIGLPNLMGALVPQESLFPPILPSPTIYLSWTGEQGSNFESNL